MTMPTMEEIASRQETVLESLGKAWAASLAPIFAAARRGVEASICPDCHNTFQQPFKCVTCGAQKLYDATLLDAQQRAERAEANIEELGKRYNDALIASANSERYLNEKIERAEAERDAAVARERDACAKECFDRAQLWLTEYGRESDRTGIAQAEALSCGEAIRARADQPEGGKS